MRVFIDFDGTLCPDPHSERPVTPPDEGAVTFLRALKRAGHTITVGSCRATCEDRDGYKARNAMREVVGYLLRHGIPFDFVDVGKPRYDVMVDRRALRLEGGWQEVGHRLKTPAHSAAG